VQKVEEVKDIENVVSHFNCDSDDMLEVFDLVEQRLEAIRDKIVEGIVKFTTNQALSKLKEQVSLILSIQVMSANAQQAYINQVC
jgi:transcription initiation factor IIE alpha subunit